jgi:hypothetical protein
LAQQIKIYAADGRNVSNVFEGEGMYVWWRENVKGM